jgi:DNA-binding response OmpR family regulator
MTQNANDTILIIEPNELLEFPYYYLEHLGTVKRVPTIGAALKEVVWNVPSLVFLSASIDPKKSLALLDTLKDASRFSLVPLIVVVDWSKEISMILGTSWGGKIAVVDIHIPKKDLISTISRVA